ncbi:MAG: hypothetical protein ACAH80_18000 [Alphaproteobacteria bacterium]
MKSAIFLTWFFTIVFFSHGLNTPSATASCVVPAAVKQMAQTAVAAPPAMNRLKPVELPEEPAQAEMTPAAYAPAEVEPASGEPPRFNPLARNAERYGDNAESYYQGKQDQLLQALMAR